MATLLFSRRFAHTPPVLAWSGLSVAGLVLALASLLNRWELQAGGPAARVAVRLPEPLPAVMLVLLSLASLLLLALILPRKLRWKRKDDEKFELYHEPPKVSPWVLLLLWAIALSPIAIFASLFWLDWTPFGEIRVAPPGGSHGTVPLAAPQTPPPPGRPEVSLPTFTGAVGVLALLGALGALLLLLWIFFGDRLAWWWGGPAGQRPAPEPLLEAVEGSLDDLRREPDARRAVILCYRRFEQALAGFGFPRSPWATPTEFMRQALGRLPLPPAAVTTLTRLFELSRFSHHALGPSDRDDAVDSLDGIKAALERTRSHAASP